MRLILILLVYSVIGANLAAQEKQQVQKAANAKSIGIRSNSREQVRVKRDNFHQRRDSKAIQMRKRMKVSNSKFDERKTKVGNPNSSKKAKLIKNRQQIKKKAQLQKLKKIQRKRALRKKR